MLPNDHRRETFLKILWALDMEGACVTGEVVKRSGVHPSFADRPHIRSAWVRGGLLELQALGLVTTLDEQKPVCWRLTTEGARIRAELTRGTELQG